MGTRDFLLSQVNEGAKAVTAHQELDHDLVVHLADLIDELKDEVD